jgi:hypothetical protein
MISWFQSLLSFKFNLYRYRTARATPPGAAAASRAPAAAPAAARAWTSSPCCLPARRATRWGPVQARIQLTRSLKPPGFNPRTLDVISWFQKFAASNSTCITTTRAPRCRATRCPAAPAPPACVAPSRSRWGCVQAVESSATHSSKAPGFNPVAYEVKTWFQNLLSNSTCTATWR